jgi:hypothetical protein
LVRPVTVRVVTVGEPAAVVQEVPPFEEYWTV